MVSQSQARKLVVVGAGPVGCLAAMAFAKRGWQVDVYEGRPDIRLPSSRAAAQQRSINLAISHRGLAALESIDPVVTRQFVETVIPMRGRMIHTIKGKQDAQLYDKDGQCINSVDRALLNEELLNAAEALPNVNVFFNCKVTGADFDERTLNIRDLGSTRDSIAHFDFCIGADGSYSVIRRQMMRIMRMDYQQEYITHEYIELKMPAGKDAQGKPTFLLEPNYLHIWPRHSFMLIALPNKDMTFTCTLFAPSLDLDRLSDVATVLEWFRSQFPDALQLIGEDNFVRTFMNNPRSPLICTKSKPYHYKDRVIILGDAAHSMVPFFGQGLNCGLEDVRVLNTVLHEEEVESHAHVPLAENGSADKIDSRLARALQRYSDGRHDDLIAICDMAMNNYIEMRHSVTTLSYLLRKILDTTFYSLFGSKFSFATAVPLLSRMPYPPRTSYGWLPLYTMVTFRPDINYATARRKAAQQGKIITAVTWAGLSLISLGGLSTWWKWKGMAAFCTHM